MLRFHATHDYQVLYDAGIEIGDGTDEERQVVREFSEKSRMFHEQIERAQCGLLSNVEYKFTGERGHDAPLRTPEIVVEKVRKLVNRVKKGE